MAPYCWMPQARRAPGEELLVPLLSRVEPQQPRLRPSMVI
jgi:hypothetical protein